MLELRDGELRDRRNQANRSIAPQPFLTVPVPCVKNRVSRSFVGLYRRGWPDPSSNFLETADRTLPFCRPNRLMKPGCCFLFRSRLQGLPGWSFAEVCWCFWKHGREVFGLQDKCLSFTGGLGLDSGIFL
jgi:hypothetical protein